MADSTYPWPVHPSNYMSGAALAVPTTGIPDVPPVVTLAPPVVAAVSVVADPVSSDLVDLIEEIKITLGHHKAPRDIMDTLDAALHKSTGTAAMRAMIEDLRIFNKALSDKPIAPFVPSPDRPINPNTGQPISRQALYKRRLKEKQNAIQNGQGQEGVPLPDGD